MKTQISVYQYEMAGFIKACNEMYIKYDIVQELEEKLVIDVHEDSPGMMFLLGKFVQTNIEYLKAIEKFKQANP